MNSGNKSSGFNFTSGDGESRVRFTVERSGLMAARGPCAVSLAPRSHAMFNLRVIPVTTFLYVLIAAVTADWAAADELPPALELLPAPAKE